MTDPNPLVTAFEKQVRTHPDRIVLLSGSRRFSLEDLDRYARQVEHSIGAADVPVRSRIGLVAANGVPFLAGVLGILRSDRVPILFDEETRTPEFESTSRGLSARGVARVSIGAGREAALRVDFGPLRGLQEGDEGGIDAPGVIQLTSGTTGQASGIFTSARSLVEDERALSGTMGIKSDDCMVATIPFSHRYGLVSLAVCCLVRGVALAMVDHRDAFGPLRTARESGATVFPTVPAYLAGLLRLTERPVLPSSVRLTVVAGAPMSPETAVAFRKCYDRGVHVLYGASEAGGITYDRTGRAAELGTVGQPVDGTRVSLEQVPHAEDGVGRVRVRSPAVAGSYVPVARESLQDGVFRSSDLARWKGTDLELLGRLDDLMNVKGLKVHPAEVESALMRMPSVLEAQVMGLAHAGSDQIAAVVASDRDDLTSAEVRDWCRHLLSDHKIPRLVKMVRRLPRNSRGKVDRAALERLLRPGR